ncbi:MAG: CARDB domain-containing protein [bacterium]
MYFGLLKEPFSIYPSIAYYGSIVNYEKGVWIKEANVGVGVKTDKALYGREDKVNISVLLKNKESIEYDANLILKIIDPKNNTIFSTETSIYLNPEEEKALGFSFILPKTYGYYTIQANVLRDNQTIGYSMAYFKLPKPILSIKLIFPETFTKGTNTILFTITNKGSITAFSSKLSFTMNDPDNNEIKETITLTNIEPKETRTVSLEIYLSKILFGTYRFSYKIKDEEGDTLLSEKSEIPCSIIINPKLDRPSYAIRDRMNLGLEIINR